MKHRLRFGALVTSVTEARRAEELGYDLVVVPADQAGSTAALNASVKLLRIRSNVYVSTPSICSINTGLIPACRSKTWPAP